MKKRILALIVVLALVGALVPAIVFAADEDTVECTVTAVLVSVSVSDGDVAYGTLALGATKNTAVYDASDNPDGSDPAQTQTITNTGTVAEDFNIKTSNADGGTNWTVASSTGLLDEFTHAYNVDATEYTGSGTIPFTTWSAADTYVNDVATDVAVDGVRYLELEIGMPTSATDHTQHTITVTVLATQSS